MTKLSRKHLNLLHFGRYVNNLWSAFTLMDSKEDIKLLFKDLFTHTEYKMFAKRMEIARRLLEGQTYEQIDKELHVTARTITNVNNILAEGGPGLRKAHDKLNALEEKYLAKQREITKNRENPFKQKIQRKTIGGAILKAGMAVIDKQISKNLKRQSAKKQLTV